MLATINHTTFENDIPLALATSAHAGTSFVPDQRGVQERQSYAAQLTLDWTVLSKLATTDEKRATLAAEFARYRQGFRTRYLAMLAAKSRCMSTMITGGSNFPTARNRKRSDAADKRTTELVEFRERAVAAIRKALTPELQPIRSGDANAVERLEDKIAKLEMLQAQMKAMNACIRKHARAGVEAQVAALVALEIPGRDKKLTETAARELLKPDFCGRIGFASYELTNNNANIRRLKERLASVSEAKATETVEHVGEHARVEDDAAGNRVRLYFPGKPSAEVRSRLKANGFRWAKSLGAWQAYSGHTTIELAKREAGVADKPTVPTCPECKAPTHPSDSNDDGVCASCLGPAAITPSSGGGDGDVPLCVRDLGCACCLHGRGAPARYACNADEAAWPCRFCWAYFPEGGFEVDEAGNCAACKGTGVHPDEDGDPADDHDDTPDAPGPDEAPTKVAPGVVTCPKCGTTADDDEDNFVLCETFRAYHPFNPHTMVATNALGTTCPSEHFDDGAEDYVLLCNHCTHEGSLSEFGADLKDWE